MTTRTEAERAHWRSRDEYTYRAGMHDAYERYREEAKKFVDEVRDFLKEEWASDYENVSEQIQSRVDKGKEIPEGLAKRYFRAAYSKGVPEAEILAGFKPKKEKKASWDPKIDMVKNTLYSLPFLVPAGLTAGAIGAYAGNGISDALTVGALATTGAAMGTLQPKGRGAVELGLYAAYTGIAAKIIELSIEAGKIRNYGHAMENWDPTELVGMGAAYGGALVAGLGLRYLVDNWQDKTKPTLKKGAAVTLENTLKGAKATGKGVGIGAKYTGIGIGKAAKATFYDLPKWTKRKWEERKERKAQREAEELAKSIEQKQRALEERIEEFGRVPSKSKIKDRLNFWGYRINHWLDHPNPITYEQFLSKKPEQAGDLEVDLDAPID